MLRRLPILAFLLLFTLQPAHADEASKRAKIKELFKAMKVDSLMKSVMASSMQQGQQMMKAMLGDEAASISPDDQKIVDRFTAKIQGIVTDELAWDKLEPDYTDIYAKAYTEDEVDGILAFYKSPAGIAMVEKQPQMVAAAQKLVLVRVQDLGPRMQQAMLDFKAELDKAHHPSAKPSSGRS
jgi:hypothetical protein